MAQGSTGDDNTSAQANRFRKGPSLDGYHYSIAKSWFQKHAKAGGSSTGVKKSRVRRNEEKGQKNVKTAKTPS